VSDLAGQCEITGVFSPVGGSGKTTIAAAMARLYAMRHKTLFFSIEQLQYTEQIFAGGSNYDMSDFLYYVHKKDKDIIPNLNKMLIRDERTGVAFLNSPQCFMDINNIDSEKWVAFFKAIASYGLVNSMVIDLGSFLSESVIEMMSACKRVVVPVLDDRMSLMKVNRLIHDLIKMDREMVMKKFVYVLNKYKGTQPHNEIEIFKTLVLDESNALAAISGDAITQRPFWHELIEFAGLLERVKNDG
jgi:MinD-like ATPase involved in chromosome partitioning or flagellar assembly